MDSLLAYSPIVEYLSTNNAKKTLRFSSPSTSSSLCITDLDPCREGKEKERKEKKKKRRNKFSAMKDSLFLLRSNVVSGRERLEREAPVEEGERGSTISSFITSPPINQYTLRFPIALERFISSIPHPWGAVIFVCTGCALSRSTYKYSGAQDLGGRV